MKRILVAALLIGSVALAKAPPGQGRACDERNKCDPGLTCIPRAGGTARCEIACDKAPKCPEDQRCVKDGPQMVCRPIVDGMPGL